MIMNFNMGESTLGNATSSSNLLAPNKIHLALFKGVEYSQSKDGKWEFMKIKFQGVEGGYFNDTTFGFDDKANVRKQTQYGENPSPYEMFMMKIKHLLNAIAPDVLAKMQNGEIVFTPKGKSDLFKQYVEFIGNLLTPYVDKQVSIKLVKNNKGEACFPPFFASVSKEGIAYMKTNFIGNDLAFSTKELENIEKQASAKPTVMPNNIADLSLDDATETPKENEDGSLMDLEF